MWGRSVGAPIKTRTLPGAVGRSLNQYSGPSRSGPPEPPCSLGPLIALYNDTMTGDWGESGVVGSKDAGVGSSLGIIWLSPVTVTPHEGGGRPKPDAKGPLRVPSRSPGPLIVVCSDWGERMKKSGPRDPRVGDRTKRTRGAAGAEPRNQERTDKLSSRVRGARPHLTADACMPPRSRSTAAARATSRPIPQATHHTTRVRCACLRTCVREFRPGRPRLV